jgi:hypothetical protein
MSTTILGLMGALRRLVEKKVEGGVEYDTIMDIIRCVEYQVIVPYLKKEASHVVKDLKVRLGEVLGSMSTKEGEEEPPQEIGEAAQKMMIGDQVVNETEVVVEEEGEVKTKKRVKKTKTRNPKKLKLDLPTHPPPMTGPSRSGTTVFALPNPNPQPQPPPTPEPGFQTFSFPEPTYNQEQIERFLDSICPTSECNE